MFSDIGLSSFFLDLIQKLNTYRLRLHFKVVEQRLRQKNVNQLPESIQQTRNQHLRRLQAYGERGIFPRNETHPGFRPCFIDQAGRECAVAHLLIESGEGQFAQHIAKKNNPAFVREMDSPELDVWTGEAGFTKEELQIIQPMYPPTPSEITLMHLIHLSVQLSGMVLILGVTGFLGVAWRTLMTLKDKRMEIKSFLPAYYSSAKWKALLRQDTLFRLLFLAAIGVLVFYALLWQYPQTNLDTSMYNEAIYSGYTSANEFHPVYQAFLNKLVACAFSLVTLVFLYWGQVRLKSHYPYLKLVMFVNLVMVGVVMYWMTMNYINLLPFDPLASNNVWYFFRNPVVQCFQDPTYPLCP